jgi:hypothetical protein
MSAKDFFHNAVRLALEKDNWLITHDPLSFELTEKVKVRIDLGAEKLITAEKDNQKIAVEVKSFIDNSYWKHDIEDNAYAIMKDTKGRVAMLHSTATQWQHRFVMDIALTEGYMELHGILSGSKSYGEEKIIMGHRDDESMNGQMQSSTVNFLSDNSWKDEIFEFADTILNNKPVTSGTSNDALETMKLVFRIYHSDEDWRKKYNIKY